MGYTHRVSQLTLPFENELRPRVQVFRTQKKRRLRDTRGQGLSFVKGEPHPLSGTSKQRGLPRRGLAVMICVSGGEQRAGHVVA